MKRKLMLFIAAFTVSVMSFAFTIIQEPKPWPVPDKSAKTPNPVKSNSESIAAGKALWNLHCSSCHGKKGLGDGSKAAQLKTTHCSIRYQKEGVICQVSKRKFLIRKICGVL